MGKLADILSIANQFIDIRQKERFIWLFENDDDDDSRNVARRSRPISLITNLVFFCCMNICTQPVVKNDDFFTDL